MNNTHKQTTTALLKTDCFYLNTLCRPVPGQHRRVTSSWRTPSPNCHQGDHLASCCCLHYQDTDVLFTFSSRQPSRTSTEQRNGEPDDRVLPDTLQRLQHGAAPGAGPRSRQVRREHAVPLAARKRAHQDRSAAEGA